MGGANAHHHRQVTPSHQPRTGKEQDTETGPDYFGKRYYSNGLGRWTSPDRPFADQHRIDPQSWNIYAYARNNPLRYIDDNGLESSNRRNNRVKIYARLLEEGTEVCRPTEAIDLGNGLFEILPTAPYDSEDERWEFPPGSVVRGKRIEEANGAYLLAISPGDSDGVCEALIRGLKPTFYSAFRHDRTHALLLVSFLPKPLIRQ